MFAKNDWRHKHVQCNTKVCECNWLPTKKIDSVGKIPLYLIVIIDGSEASINKTFYFLTPNIFNIYNDGS
jgi:hypothetical protein